ncbi:MAG: RidA family protein [Clostridia bacterium]|nr:RidA family protein [Clostridia bacterium]MDQ7791489.1 RidA family protein [Clostridia bacterium]
MNYETRIKELGLTIPDPPAPVASYLPGLQAGQFIFTSGQLPFENGRLAFVGRLGGDYTTQEGSEAARLCALNALGVVRSLAGSLDRVKQVVKITVFVNSLAGFTEQPQVANGASELLQEIFGEAGRHARSAVGVNALPLGAAVELEMVVMVK